MSGKRYQGFVVVDEIPIGPTPVFYTEDQGELYRAHVRQKSLTNGTPILNSGEWLDRPVDFDHIKKVAESRARDR